MTQQYPEHILKQADEMAHKTAIEASYIMAAEGSINSDQLEKIVRDTINLRALLMAQSEFERVSALRVLQSNLQELERKAKALDWLDAATRKVDPTCQLIEVGEGFEIGKPRVTIYDGRTTHSFNGETLLSAIENAMEKQK